ncbi:MAG: DUF58 domain-containing protein [Acidimicrobiales bacterium]
MPTRRGYAACAAGVVLLVVGRVLGLVELYVIGTGAIGLALLAVARVRLARLDLEVDHLARPGRLEVGGQATVEVRVRSFSSLRTPVLVVHDLLGDGGRSPRFLLAPLSRSEEVAVGYTLPTVRRGILRVGPAKVEVGDPFGLATSTRELRGAATVIVTPRREVVGPPPPGPAVDPRALGVHQHVLGAAGAEFYALRPYTSGDDLRRVHWPSTARRGELQVRQDEVPWQGRSTLAVDLRRAVHDEETIERVLSAAASVAFAALRDGHAIRLLTTGRVDTGFGDDDAHLQRIEERLAEAAAGPPDGLRWLGEKLRESVGGGCVVALTTTVITTSELARLEHLSEWGQRVVTVSFAPDTGALPAAAPGGAGTGELRSGSCTVGSREGFVPVWEAARAAWLGSGVGRR